MTTAPLVSILMNCHNGEKYLRQAIDSVYAQTYENWEIIFWDNASTDGSRAIAQSYDHRVKYHYAAEKTRLGEARNEALQHVTGTYLAFLDVDDIFLPEMLAKQVALIQSGDYGFVYGGTIIIDEKGDTIGRRMPRYESGRLLGELLERYDVSMCSVLIRKDVIDAEQLQFDTSFGYCPDYNMFMKVAAKYPVGVLHAPIVKYRRSPDSLSRKVFHLVSREVGATLDMLETRFPDACRAVQPTLSSARAKLHFYDAVDLINQGNYAAARAALAPVRSRRWEYLAIYLALFLPIPRPWMLRALNR